MKGGNSLHKAFIAWLKSHLMIALSYVGEIIVEIIISLFITWLINQIWR
jgi:hypothetical protein